jgi:hypothetical protein
MLTLSPQKPHDDNTAFSGLDYAEWIQEVLELRQLLLSQFIEA